MARKPVTTVILCLAVTIILAIFAVNTFRIDTDNSDMLSEELEFRRLHAEHRALFPQFSEALTVVVDAPSASTADEAVDRVLAAVAAAPDRFRDAFAPSRDAFFRRHGLLYLPPEELEALSERLIAATPFLSALARDPTSQGLLGVLGVGLRDASLGAPPAGVLATTEEVDRHAGLAQMLDRLRDSAMTLHEGRPAAVDWSALMTGAVEDGAARRLITVRPRLDYGALQPASEALRALRAVADEIETANDGAVDVRLTGAKALEAEELKSVEANIGLSGLISLVVVSLVLTFGLRSVRLVAALLAALLLGLVWTGAFAMAAIGHLNLISVAFAVLFIGLGVDFGVHLVLRYREERRARDHESALRVAATRGGPALALCAVTGSIAFLSFLPTDYRGLAELGLISGAGLLIALFLSLTLIPALLSLRPSSEIPPRKTDGVAPPTARPGGRRHAAVAGVALAVGIACLVVLPDLRFDFDPMNLRDPASESVTAFRDLAEDARTNPYHLVALAPDRESAARLAAKVSGLAEVAETRTVDGLVPKAQAEKLLILEDLRFLLGPVLDLAATEPAPDATALDIAFSRFERRLADALARPDALGPRLAASARNLAQALATVLGPMDGAAREDRVLSLDAAFTGGLAERLSDLRLSLRPDRPVMLEDLPDTLRARMQAPDGTARVEIHPAIALDGDGMDRFVTAVAAVAPSVTGTPAIVVAAGEAVIRAFVQALGLSLVLIVLLLWAVLRRADDVLLVMTPLLLAALATGAASVLLDLPFNFANVIVIPLLFGLGVDSGIHIVLRAREGHAPLRTSTVRAVVVSALTTIGSFGSLAISSHAGTASMGKLLTIAIVCTMVSTLLVLPALLVLRARWTRAKERP